MVFGGVLFFFCCYCIVFIPLSAVVMISSAVITIWRQEIDFHHPFLIPKTMVWKCYPITPLFVISFILMVLSSYSLIVPFPYGGLIHSMNFPIAFLSSQFVFVICSHSFPGQFLILMACRFLAFHLFPCVVLALRML